MADERPLDEGPAPLSGNKAIEDAAIAFVMGLEREAGRSCPQADTDGLRRLVAGDSIERRLQVIRSALDLHPAALGRVVGSSSCSCTVPV